MSESLKFYASLRSVINSRLVIIVPRCMGRPVSLFFFYVPSFSDFFSEDCLSEYNSFLTLMTFCTPSSNNFSKLLHCYKSPSSMTDRRIFFIRKAYCCVFMFCRVCSSCFRDSQRLIWATARWSSCSKCLPYLSRQVIRYSNPFLSMSYFYLSNCPMALPLVDFELIVCEDTAEVQPLVPLLAYCNSFSSSFTRCPKLRFSSATRIDYQKYFTRICYLYLQQFLSSSISL